MNRHPTIRYLLHLSLLSDEEYIAVAFGSKDRACSRRMPRLAPLFSECVELERVI
jgi:hypothetical protein